MRALALALTLLAGAAAAASSPTPVETPSLAARVAAGELPPVAERLPDAPLVVDPTTRPGRSFGEQGGVIRTLIGRAKDVRLAVVWGYARLVGYDERYNLVPDLLRSFEVREGRDFTLRLRPGHKWSDGHPFTSEDFRYWWEDVALNPELSPSGPPASMMVDGKPPVASFPDPETVRFVWDAPNPRFLPALASAAPLFIYRPAHALKPLHAAYADPETLAARVAEAESPSWAALHNKRDDLYAFDDPDLPTLQPWVNVTPRNGQRYLLERNPFYHRVDARGRQLPYVDALDMIVAAPGLIPAKTTRGESDLQSRALSLSDAPVLKMGEDSGDYVTHLWRSGYAAEIALYPNLNYADPVWRGVLRDARFRRALSIAISRRTLNKILYFGLARETGMSALPESPFYDPANANAWADYDPARANALLDEMGLTRDGAGLRRLPDGRPLTVIVETAGERREELDALELIATMWADVGVGLIYRPLDRDILRNKAYSGAAMMPVWFGWNLGIPTADAPPTEVTPVDQSVFTWPMWGQWFQTHGESGEPPDLPAAVRLLELYEKWASAPDDGERAEAWREILEIHADQVFAIGLLSGVPQPVVASARLRNLPDEAVYAWEPGGHFGVHRIDELWFDEDKPR